MWGLKTRKAEIALSMFCLWEQGQLTHLQKMVTIAAIAGQKKKSKISILSAWDNQLTSNKKCQAKT